MTLVKGKNALVGLVLLVILAGFVGYYLVNKSSVKTSPAPIPTSVQQPSPTSVKQTGLANPASVNCEKVGGKTVIKTRGDGGQYGLCEFEGGYACEEWALFRGDCPVGGVRTTGFDTQAQMYCAWLGGSTLTVPNAKCTLPDGTVCLDADLFNGTCSPNIQTSPVSSPLTNLLQQIASKVAWGQPQQTSQDVFGTTYSGMQVTGTLKGTIQDEMAIETALKNQGWAVNNSMIADGPTGGERVYTKGNQLLNLEFRNMSFVPPPGETNCPCNYQLTLFHTDLYK